MEAANPRRRRAATLIADVLNPFAIFTALYALAAISEADLTRALLYLATELAAAALVAGYVFALRRKRRVGDFWLRERHERLIPALVLLSAFAALLAALALLAAPPALLRLTLSMGLAAAAVAALTLLWKASAHSAVAGHAAAVAALILPPLLALPFVLALPAVVWARVTSGAHTLPQTLAGASVGASLAALLLS